MDSFMIVFPSSHTSFQGVECYRCLATLIEPGLNQGTGEKHGKRTKFRTDHFNKITVFIHHGNLRYPPQSYPPQEIRPY